MAQKNKIRTMRIQIRKLQEERGSLREEIQTACVMDDEGMTSNEDVILKKERRINEINLELKRLAATKLIKLQ